MPSNILYIQNLYNVFCKYLNILINDDIFQIIFLTNINSIEIKFSVKKLTEYLMYN